MSTASKFFSYLFSCRPCYKTARREEREHLNSTQNGGASSSNYNASADKTAIIIDRLRMNITTFQNTSEYKQLVWYAKKNCGKDPIIIRLKTITYILSKPVHKFNPNDIKILQSFANKKYGKVMPGTLAAIMTNIKIDIEQLITELTSILFQATYSHQSTAPTNTSMQRTFTAAAASSASIPLPENLQSSKAERTVLLLEETMNDLLSSIDNYAKKIKLESKLSELDEFCLIRYPLMDSIKDSLENLQQYLNSPANTFDKNKEKSRACQQIFDRYFKQDAGENALSSLSHILHENEPLLLCIHNFCYALLGNIPSNINKYVYSDRQYI